MPTTEEAETLPAKPARREFVAQADAICAEANAEIRAQARERFRDRPPDREEQERFITEAWVPNMQEQIDRLRELTPPKYDRREIRFFLGGVQGTLDDLAQEPSLIPPPPRLTPPEIFDGTLEPSLGIFDETVESRLGIPDPSANRGIFFGIHEIAKELRFRKCLH